MPLFEPLHVTEPKLFETAQRIQAPRRATGVTRTKARHGLWMHQETGMARYFLHLTSNGERLADEEGEEHRDDAAACAAVVASARDLMSAEVRDGLLNLDQSIDLCDADGRLIRTIRFIEVLRIPR